MVKKLPANAVKRCTFDPWVRKIPWRRAWQPTPVFLPGEPQGWEPGGLQSLGSHRVGHVCSDSAWQCRWPVGEGGAAASWGRPPSPALPLAWAARDLAQGRGGGSGWAVCTDRRVEPPSEVLPTLACRPLDRALAWPGVPEGACHWTRSCHARSANVVGPTHWPPTRAK